MSSFKIMKALNIKTEIQAKRDYLKLGLIHKKVLNRLQSNRIIHPNKTLNLFNC